MSTEVVTLRTGAEVPDILIRATAIALRTLLDEHPVALYEAVMVARDKAREPFGNTSEALRGYGLLDTAGKMHAAIRDVILASTEGRASTSASSRPTPARRRRHEHPA